ncbi:hypothetical protein BGW80DRAFT_1276262, partial [Lactifluus volemus]
MPHSVAVAVSLAMLGADLYPELYVQVTWRPPSSLSPSSPSPPHYDPHLLFLTFTYYSPTFTGQCLTTFRHFKCCQVTNTYHTERHGYGRTTLGLLDASFWPHSPFGRTNISLPFAQLPRDAA